MITTQRIELSTGVRLEYLLAGPKNGETLLFVHGLGPNLRQFEPQALDRLDPLDKARLAETLMRRG